MTSDTSALQVESFAKQVFAAPDRPDGVLLGSATASMAMVLGGEACGLVLGARLRRGHQGFVRFLRRFPLGYAGRARGRGQGGRFSGPCVMQAIDRRRDGAPMQHLDVPEMLADSGFWGGARRWTRRWRLRPGMRRRIWRGSTA